MNTVSEAIARPARTTVQGGIGLVFAQFVDAWLYDMNDIQFGSLVALLTIVISFVQNVVEDGIGKAILRNVPSKEVPVVDEERGAVNVDTLWMILGIVGIVLIVLLIAGAL